MANINDLLKGYDPAKHNTPQAVEKLINDNASELKAKVLIDDGDKDVYVPKARLDEEIGKKKTIQKTLDDTNTEIENIKKTAGDNKALVDQITVLQNTNKDLDVQLKSQAVDTAIRLKAIELKAKDKTGADVLAFIDKSKITANADGTFVGIDEQFKTLQETKAYIFDDVVAGGTGNPGQKGKGGEPITEGIGELLAKQNQPPAGGAPVKTVDELYFK